MLFFSAAAVAAPAAVDPTVDVWLSAAEQPNCPIASEVLAAGEIDAPISSLGTVAYNDLRLARVYSPVSGMVVNILAPLGARVVSGSPLAVLTSADLAGAKADLVRARAALVAAKETAGRLDKLFSQRAASAREVEAAKDSLRRAEAERARAQQQYALLTAGSRGGVEQNFTLRSPIAGEVVARNVGLGGQVTGQYAGGSSPPLFTVADLASVWLLADLHEGEIGRVERGALATVRSAAPAQAEGLDAATLARLRGPVGPTTPGRRGVVLPQLSGGPPIAGTVDWLADVLDPDSHTLKVRCVVDNADRRLRPNMRVVFDIQGSRRAGVSVTAASIVFVEQQPYVFVEAADGQGGRRHFHLRPIDLDDNSPMVEAAFAAQASLVPVAPVVPRPTATDPLEVSVGTPAPPSATGPISRRRIVRRGLMAGERVVVTGTDCLLRHLAEGRDGKAAAR